MEEEDTRPIRPFSPLPEDHWKEVIDPRPRGEGRRDRLPLGPRLAESWRRWLVVLDPPPPSRRVVATSFRHLLPAPSAGEQVIPVATLDAWTRAADAADAESPVPLSRSARLFAGLKGVLRRNK